MANSKLSLSGATLKMEVILDIWQKLTAIAPSTAFGKAAKYLVLAAFLLNWRAWPFVWHFRVFKPVLFGPDMARRLLKFTALFKSKTQALKDEEIFWTSHTPIGQTPFGFSTVYSTYSSFDDSDYNLHLSNSSYGKTFDYTRFKSAIAAFPQFLRAGGLIPLAATDYHFIREIPIFKSYQVHASVGSWDHKWIYVVGKFVTPIQKGQKTRKASETPRTPPVNNLNAAASLRTPAKPEDVESSINTPSELTNKSGSITSSDALQSVNASLNLRQAPEGTVLHTIAVSRLCFKLGRITVPPAIVLALNGFSDSSAQSYSPSNPPPHWQKVLELGHPLHGGSIRKLRDFLKGGWKEVPENERWWETALSGDMEIQRRANLEAFESIRAGMDFLGTK